MKKRIPKSKSEDKEQESWGNYDSTEYLNLKSAERVLFPNLKPTTRKISLRQLAEECDVPYQSLIKMILQERIEQDFKSRQLPRGG
jgi:hypothetical protein